MKKALRYKGLEDKEGCSQRAVGFGLRGTRYYSTNPITRGLYQYAMDGNVLLSREIKMLLNI